MSAHPRVILCQDVGNFGHCSFIFAFFVYMFLKFFAHSYMISSIPI